MNNKNEKILYCVKSNRFLFVAKAVWNIIWFSIGTTISIGLGTLLLSEILGFLCNDNKLNLPVIYLGASLIPLTIASGAGALGNRSIGTAAAGGMLIGTFVGIFLIPGLYVIFESLATYFKKRKEEEQIKEDEYVY